MLLHLPDLLTSDEVAHAQHLLKEAPWTDGRKGTGELARQVKNNEQLDHEGDIARSIRELVLRGLDRNTTFFSAALPKRCSHPASTGTGGSNFYGNHIDGAVRYMPESGQRLRTDVSCTVFLNDPEDYDGGELTIADTYGEKMVKLPAGHAVLYPGTSLHQVKPVTRGHRIACFFWIESLVRSDEQRRMLYELDMNLLAIRRRHGDSEETTALTGVYHNMLRMWADT